MSRFTDAMRGLGFGTDPAGDARRRDALPGEIRRLNDEEFEALRQIHRGPLGSPHLRRALAAEEARAMSSRPPMTGPGDPPEPPGHALRRERTPGGSVVVFCECGRWDGGWTGARSRQVVLADYATHVAAETAGPLRVRSERADRPELEA